MYGTPKTLSRREHSCYEHSVTKVFNGNDTNDYSTVFQCTIGAKPLACRAEARRMVGGDRLELPTLSV